MHIAGEKDQIVPFAGQQRTITAVRRLNGCEDQGQDWAKNCTLYRSKQGAPVVAYIHPGGHIVPNESPALMVRFFKEHSRAPRRLPANSGMKMASAQATVDRAFARPTGSCS